MIRLTDINPANAPNLEHAFDGLMRRRRLYTCGEVLQVGERHNTEGVAHHHTPTVHPMGQTMRSALRIKGSRDSQCALCVHSDYVVVPNMFARLAPAQLHQKDASSLT